MLYYSFSSNFQVIEGPPNHIGKPRVNLSGLALYPGNEQLVNVRTNVITSSVNSNFITQYNITFVIVQEDVTCQK